MFSLNLVSYLIVVAISISGGLVVYPDLVSFFIVGATIMNGCFVFS